MSYAASLCARNYMVFIHMSDDMFVTIYVVGQTLYYVYWYFSYNTAFMIAIVAFNTSTSPCTTSVQFPLLRRVWVCA